MCFLHYFNNPLVCSSVELSNSFKRAVDFRRLALTLLRLVSGFVLMPFVRLSAKLAFPFSFKDYALDIPLRIPGFGAKFVLFCKGFEGFLSLL
jgi:hypothetical protein